ncbi:MAG: cupin domain-containing protein [Roseovarius sp.]
MTTPPSIIGATDMELTPAGQRAGADSGDPQIAVRELSNQAGIAVGIWECQPGGWPVVERPDCEVATILSGKGVITDESGAETVIEAGSVVTLPKGWTGRWDIHETMRKVYVIMK